MVMDHEVAKVGLLQRETWISPDSKRLALCQMQRRKNVILKNKPEHPVVFAARFERSRRLLHLIACRVLGSPEEAGDAIENSWVTAARNPPRFKYEGEFRSWLLRVVIDEALALRRQRSEASVRITSQQGDAVRYRLGSSRRQTA